VDTIRSHAPVQAGHLEHKELATMCFCGMRSCWLAVKAVVGMDMQIIMGIDTQGT